MLIKDGESGFTLTKLKGTTVSAGKSVKISIKPFLYQTTTEAKEKFSYERRKCIYDGEFEMPRGQKYSLDQCLAEIVSLKFDEQCANSVNGTVSWPSARGVPLKCKNDLLNGMGEWLRGKIIPNSDEELLCNEACERQENVLDIAEQTFPNEVFANTDDFLLVVKKLFWSCAEVVPKGGHKKSGIEKKYPLICPLYDKHIYKNINISEEGFNLDDEMGRNFSQFTAKTFEWNMRYDYDIFTREVLKYCQENLVRIEAYISSPYVTIYEKDVVMTQTTLIANIGGILGLCMGFSLISLAEIIFYIIINPLLTRMAKMEKRHR